MSGYHDDEEEYEPYEEDEEYDEYEEEALAAAGRAVQIAPRAFSLPDEGEDEEDEEEDEDEDEGEDDARMMPPPPPRAPRGPGVPSSSGRDYAAALAGRGTGRDEDESEEEEEDEEVENEELFGDGEDLETYLKHAGPNSYNILADRRRKALRQRHEEEDAFNRELKVKGYENSQDLIDVTHADKLELLAKNPNYAMFFQGAGGSAPTAGPRGKIGRGRVRRGVRRTRRRVISAEAAKKLGEANLLFTQGEAQYPRAIELLTEVIRLIPNEPDAYATLGTIYSELKNDKKALDFLMISAHLEPGNKEKWNNLAEMSIRLNNPRQALYCLGQALRLDPDDHDNRWDQARLYVDIGEPKRALEQFQNLRERIPDNPEVAVELAKMHYQMGNPDLAESTLDELMTAHPTRADATLVNILAELKMDRRGFDQTVRLIESSREHMRSLAERQREAEHAKMAGAAGAAAYNAAIDEGTDKDAAFDRAKAETAAKLATERETNPTDIPLDLTTRLGMSLLYLGRFDEAYAQLEKIKGEDVELYDDLYMDAAETCWAVANLADVSVSQIDSHRLVTQAEFMWTKLLDVQKYDDEPMWSKIAECIRVRIERGDGSARTASAASLGSKAAEAVVKFYRTVLARHPDSIRAKIPLAEALIAAGGKEEAVEMLPAASDLDDLDKSVALRILDIHRQTGETGGDDDFLKYTLPLARQSLEEFKDKEEAKPAKAKAKKTKGGRKRKKAEKDDANDLFNLGPRGRRKAVRVEDDEDEDDEDEDDEDDEVKLQEELDDAAAALELGAEAEEDQIPEEDSFGIILQCASALHKARRNEEAYEMIEKCLAQAKSRGLSKTQVRDLNHVKALVCHALGASNFKGMKGEAAKAARHVALNNSTDADALNLYVRLAMDAGQRADCAKTFQSIVSMHDVHGVDSKKRVPALIMSGIVHSQQGAWATALADLMHAIALGPEESTAALSGGIAALQYSMKHIDVPEARHHWVLKAVAMLQHAGRLRVKQEGTRGMHEGDYNLARGLQQLGLNHLAVPLYERCLEKGADELQQECAQNLSLIYEQSGATALRDQVLRKYVNHDEA